jgi:chromatin structure-remodeling complex subunit RSC9
MVINKDEQGRPLPQNVFVIAGIRFKRSVGKCGRIRESIQDRSAHFRYKGRARTYLCRWEGCDSPSGYLSPEALYQHLKEKHVTPITSTADEPIPCRWSACRFKHATFSHMATHIPPPLDPTKEPTIRRLITHPASSADSINSPFVTYRQPPTLPPDHRLRYSGLLSPLDSHGQPASDAFYAALVLRNLAKSLREDIERNEDGQGDLENGRQARKRRKMEQEGAFGLPAPPGLLDGNGTANILPGLQQINALSHVERNQARNAFRGIVEETVLDVLGMGGAIAGKLIDCVGI